MEWDGGVEWNGRSGIGMGWRSGMGLRSPERVGKMSEMSENVGGGLNEIWYMRRSGMGLWSPERVGKMSEMSENVGGGLNEIWYMTNTILDIF